MRQSFESCTKDSYCYEDGKEETISVDEVVIGCCVNTGASIPVDGVVVEGRTSVDQSALTGESMPVEKNVGDKVHAATVNKSGYFKFKAEKVGNDTTLSRL